MTAWTLETIHELDARDPLARFRQRFELPAGVIYLDGNSLGALPTVTRERVADVVAREWGQDLIRSWNTNAWITLPGRVGDKIARLIGAAPGEVVAADSTSVNLFKLVAAAVKMRPDRRVIVSEAGNFPTDLYILQGLAELLDGRIELRLVERERVVDSIDERTAAVVLTHVHYKTGAMWNLAEVTAAAHERGALVIWDLSHSTGAVPVELDAANADFAVGCGYKYLNGGPGAPGYLYVATRHQEAVRPPLSGWMGHAAPFAFTDEYRAGAGILRNLCGTPGVLGMAALEASVDLFLEADMAAIRAKSMALGELFLALVDQTCAGHGFDLACPRDATHRGSQVSLAHPEGYAICQALIARGVIGDFRAPDILRFGFAPLYLSYRDVWDAALHLGAVMEHGEWRRPENRVRQAVT